MSKHYALCERDDWMSPAELMALVRLVRLIAFDPCSPMDRFNWHADYGCNGEVGVVPWCATPDAYGGNGLKAEWAKIASIVGGLVYVNPPYGGRRRIIDAWIEKCATESVLGAEVVGCVPASTGANWFRKIWETADAICFPYGRLSFVKPEVKRPAPQLRLFDAGEDVKADEDNSATFWSSIPYWGGDVDRFYEAFGEYGHIVEPRSRSGEARRVLGRVAALIAEVDADLVRRVAPEQGR